VECLCLDVVVIKFFFLLWVPVICVHMLLDSSLKQSQVSSFYKSFMAVV